MKTTLIAEIGNMHEGSLGFAMHFADLALSVGADVVKFQMHFPEFESSSNEPFRIRFTEQDASRSNYWNRVGFSEDSWKLLKQHCDNIGIEFLCSPFSLEAAYFLHNILNVRRFKIGSGEATNLPLLEYLSKTQKQVIISTGLVNFSEIQQIVDFFEIRGSRENLILMHCVSQYPTKIENSGLDLISLLKSFGCQVGLSDHSGKLSTAIFGISKGISALEVHMKPYDGFYGPDSSSSLNLKEIKLLREIIDDFEILSKSKMDKNEYLLSVSETARIFRKSIYWKESLKTGTRISLDHLSFLKPNDGIDVLNVYEVIGKKTTKNVKKGTLVNLDEIE